MCNWHKKPAKEIAETSTLGQSSNEISESFNHEAYTIALAGMGLFRVEQDQIGLDKLYTIDGFNPKELVKDSGVLEKDKAKAIAMLDQFETSYLNRCPHTAQKRLEDAASQIRVSIDEIIAEHGLTAEKLNLDAGVTAAGFKISPCVEPDPRENGPMMDLGVMHLYTGYDTAKKDYASKPLSLATKDELHKLSLDESYSEHDRAQFTRLEPVRAAAEQLLSIPNMHDLLFQSFEDAITVIIKRAQEDLDAGRGVSGKSSCKMCGHDEEDVPVTALEVTHA